MMRTLVLLGSLALVTFAFAPVASADVGTPTCQITLHTWYERVHCGTTTTAVDSVESWCPGYCQGPTLLVCSGTLLFPCTILP